LNSVDRQVADIQQKLNENDLVLKRTTEEKEEMGVNLYMARAELTRMNETYSVV
jgi:hypothetical protein